MRSLLLFFCLFFSLLQAKNNDIVRIIAFDKLQGRLETTEEGLGLFDLKDYLSYDYHNPLLISLTDNFQGSFSSITDKGIGVAKEIRKLSPGLALLGNQDLCFGMKQYQKNLKSANITTLATNLISKNPKYLRSFPKVIYITHKNYKIAFLGGYYPDFFVNKDIQIGDLVTSIKKEVLEILSSPSKDASSAIIVLLYLPNSFDSFSKKITNNDLREISKIKGVSAILVSDKNASYLFKVKGTPIISTSLKKNEVSQLDIEFDSKFKIVKSIQAKIVPIKALQNKKQVAYSQNKLSKIATTAFDINNKASEKDFRTPLGNFVCKTLSENNSTDFVLLPQNIFKQSITKGDITIQDIFNIFGRNYRLFTAKITGKKLKEILGNIIFARKNYQIYAPELKYSSKITSLKCSTLFGLSPVKDDKLYRVLTTQEGFEEFLINERNKKVCDEPLVNSLVDELQGKKITAKQID